MNEKICSSCKTIKPISEYHKSSKSRDGLQSNCKICGNAKTLRSMKKKPSLYSGYRKTAENKLLSRYSDWKRQQGCKYCGEVEPCCLELHHLDPKEKEGHPSNFRYRKWEVFLKEAGKCVVLCSNCHKKVHAGLINIDSIPTVSSDAFR